MECWVYLGRDVEWETVVPWKGLYVSSFTLCSSPSSRHVTNMDPTDHHQLTLILDVLGTPTMEDYYGIKSRRAREYIRSLPFKKRIPFSAMFPKTSPQALDLLEKLLAFNPAKRITVEDALKHPYLEPYHDPEDEPTAPPIPDEFFDFDRRKDELSKEQLKSMLPSLRHLPPFTMANIRSCSSHL